jgi:hypothetical protein
MLARVSSSNLRGSVSAVFSYVQSAVSSAIGTNSPRSGSSLLTVTGSSFGAASYSQMLLDPLPLQHLYGYLCPLF